MVRLGFSTEIKAKLSQVWDYYSTFQNIVEWDPNTTYCKMTKESPNKLEIQYTLKSVFNCKESTLIYNIKHFQVGKQKCRLVLFGQNQNVECLDDITFTSTGNNQTRMKYRADISLKGLKVLFTPFILSPLKQLQQSCRKGVEERNKTKWG